MFQFRNFRHPGSLLPKGNWSIIHGRDPIPCRTTYIEYKSQGEDSPSFWGTPPNSIGFHGKVVFFSLFYGTGRGGNLRWAWKTHFFKQNKKISFRVTWCFFNVPVQELQTSRVATPQRELIYTLIHGRDPIPCRTTYIEYKSQGEDSPFFIGTPPNSIGFHCKVSFFHCSTAPVVGVTLGELEQLFF